MDTTLVLKAVIDAGLDDVCFFGIFDPISVEKLNKAGEGVLLGHRWRNASMLA
eukprot:SAG31_NODE_1467_length_8227_cov_7.040108_8_plen_53_part_00